MGDLPPGGAYKFLSSLVVPRPIAFVSTLSLAGVPNLAPFSFFMIGGSNPPSLMFSPTSGEGGAEKDSLRNSRETGEFVVNLVERQIADGMNATSRRLPPEESEWDLTSFTAIPSTEMRPARVQESFAHFECKLFQIVTHGAGPGAANYVIGEVVVAHLRDDLVVDGHPDPHKIAPIARMGADLYLDLAEAEGFRLTRP